MKTKVIKLRKSGLSALQIADKVSLTVDQIYYICKKAEIQVKNMKKSKKERENKMKIKRREDFLKKLEKLEKIPLTYTNIPEDLKRCIENHQDPIATPENISLQQRRIKARHDKIAEEIVRGMGFEPDKPVIKPKEGRPKTRRYKDYSGHEAKYFDGDVKKDIIE